MPSSKQVLETLQKLPCFKQMKEDANRVIDSLSAGINGDVMEPVEFVRSWRLALGEAFERELSVYVGANYESMNKNFEEVVKALVSDKSFVEDALALNEQYRMRIYKRT